MKKLRPTSTDGPRESFAARFVRDDERFILRRGEINKASSLYARGKRRGRLMANYRDFTQLEKGDYPRDTYVSPKRIVNFIGIDPA